MSASSRRRHVFAATLLLVPTAAASAQVSVRPMTDTTRPQQTIFTSRDALVAAGFVGLTVAMYPLDQYIKTHLRNQATPANQFLDESASRVEYITTPGSFIIGGTLYAVGTLTDKHAMRDLGWHGTEAVLLGSGITNLLKGLLGRARPDLMTDTRPSDFRLAEGFSASGRRSFPSGHTTAAFAAAAAVTSEVDRQWPKYTWYVAPVLYGGATLAGLSRMYHNRHWASDVALGAGIGTFSGLKVVKYSHAHPDNFIDRVMLRTTIAPDGNGGAYLVWTMPAPR